MSKLVLEANPHLLVLDEARLEAMQINSICMACVCHGLAIPAQGHRTP